MTPRGQNHFIFQIGLADALSANGWFRNPVNPACTLSELSSVSQKVVSAKQLSLIRSSDVLSYLEKPGLEAWTEPVVCVMLS